MTHDTLTNLAAFDGLTLTLKQLQAQMLLASGEDFRNLSEKKRELVHGGMMDGLDDCLRLVQSLKP